jgi:glutathione synthase/RimK-type ligase-like ATP-grasp enzyme
MRLYLILVRRVPPVPSPLLVDVAARLRTRGYEVESGTPEEMLVDAGRLTWSHDLYLLKSHTELALSLAASLHAQGARLLNPYPACAAAQDKVLAVRRLRAAGVPVPRTFVTADLGRLRELLEERAPLLVKPVRGHRGTGVHVLHGPPDLAELPELHGPVVVQDFVAGPGEDLKVYVVGERVWMVRKPFSPSSFSVPGRPAAVTPEVEAIALRAGAACGLGLFGLDVIESPDGPVVVDLNYFPGYKGCADVAGPMAAFIADFAESRCELRLPPLQPLSDAVPLRAALPPAV